MSHQVKANKNQFRVIVLFLIFFINCSKGFAGDYIISVFDSNSSKNLTNTGFRILFCKSLFSNRSISPSVVRVQRTASYSVHGGVRKNEFRGLQMQERSIEEFERVSNVAISRILFDWKKTGKYDDISLQRIFDLHRRLSLHRLKLITTESYEDNRTFSYLESGSQGMKFDTEVAAPEKFSAIRIYDSSPIMKSYGRKYSIANEDPIVNLELTERVFPDFHLTEQLQKSGIKRAEYTWSLGLVDVSGKQESALLTLIAQTADLLDLHYNQRDFFNFNRVSSIAKEDVDIIFYGVNPIRVYYKRALGIEPLKDENGEPVVVKKNNNEFFVFHIKGSDFIKKFFDLRYHNPLYGNENGLRNEQAIHDFYRKQVIEAESKLNPAHFEVHNLSDFVRKARPILDDLVRYSHSPQSNEIDLSNILARFLLLRRNLPSNIYDSANDKINYRVLMEIDNTMRLQEGYENSQRKGLVATLALLELLLRDPMTYVINNTQLKNNL